MRLPAPNVSSVAHLLALGGLLAHHGAGARPSSADRAAWLRAAPQRRAFSDMVKGKRGAPGLSPAAGGRPEVRQAAASCAGSAAVGITAPKKNLWDQFGTADAAAVVAWLFDQPEFNLTLTDEATTWDNTVYQVETLAPNKTDTLAYLDGDTGAPTRWAKVILDMRATDEPYYQEIMVGPLPIDKATTTWTPLTYPLTRKTDGKIRNLSADDSLEGALYLDWIYPIARSIADITLDLWNATGMGLDNDTIYTWGTDPLWEEDGRIIRWDSFANLVLYLGMFDASTLLPLGLHFKSDVTGRDPSQWALQGWFYNGVFYETTEAFRTAYWNGEVEKLGGSNYGDWVGTDPAGPAPAMDDRFPPAPVAPGGSRYAVDAGEKYVEWMDFSFYLGFSRDTGLSLHDVRYRGERILYELALNEAMAHYAGAGPTADGTAYLDSSYGIGTFAFELVPGYDCPSYSTFLNSSFYFGEETHINVNSICLFEYNADFPVQRHTGYDYVTVTKNTYFVVRSIYTVANYDYVMSYYFHLDGSMSVDVRASGYILGEHASAGSGDYGYQVYDMLTGSMHDHVLHFKADFDILGTANTMQTVTPTPVTTTFPWSGNRTRNTMQLARAFVASEDEPAAKAFRWADHPGTHLLVVNTDAAPGAHGELRGYRVVPGAPTAHLTVRDSTNLANAARWAEADVQVSRQKDAEWRSAHALALNDVHAPPVEFAAFFDGESLLQEDLVVWFNLGMHHVPHSGDMPNTLSTTAHSAMTFMPFNYFTRDESRKTTNQVRINFYEGNITGLRTFGQAQSAGVCEVDYGAQEAAFLAFTGAEVVRKYPYNDTAFVG